MSLELQHTQLCDLQLCDLIEPPNLICKVIYDFPSGKKKWLFFFKCLGGAKIKVGPKRFEVEQCVRN